MGSNKHKKNSWEKYKIIPCLHNLTFQEVFITHLPNENDECTHSTHGHLKFLLFVW